MIDGIHRLELSPRQLDCLRLAAQGLTSRQIGKMLGISPRTLNEHIVLEIKGEIERRSLACSRPPGLDRLAVVAG